MNWDWIFDFSDFGPRGGWRGPRRGFFRSGEVRLALLSLLAESPGHGYQLMKRLEKRSGGLYQASAGTIYPVLQQLEDEGLVRSHEEDGKRAGVSEGSLRWRVEQGIEMGRPSLLEVEAELEGGRVVRAHVGGRSVMVSRGTMRVPDEVARA